MIVFDLETTGTNPVEDRIVQLYAAKVNDKFVVIDELELLINPTVQIPEEAIAVHGITNEAVKDMPTFAMLATKIRAFFDGEIIAGYNSNKYDVIMLQEEFSRTAVKQLDITNDMLLDALQVEIQLCSHKLTETFKRYYNVDYSEVIGAAHGAKADTLATLKVIEAQFDAAHLDENDTDCLQKYRALGKPSDTLDLSGYFAIANGEAVFNFGKHKGKLLKDNQSYLSWMLTSSFPSNTKNAISKLLANNFDITCIMPKHETEETTAIIPCDSE